MQVSQFRKDSCAYRAWAILKYTWVIFPIVVGLDKFMNGVVFWPVYLSPMIAKMLPFSVPVLMKLVGVIEIAAGVMVAIPSQTKTAAYVLTAWLILIALNLVSMGMYYDIAARDVALAMSTLALALLTCDVQRSNLS